MRAGDTENADTPTHSRQFFTMRSLFALALVLASAPGLVQACGFATFADLPGIEEACKCWGVMLPERSAGWERRLTMAVVLRPGCGGMKDPTCGEGFPVSAPPSQE